MHLNPKHMFISFTRAISSWFMTAVAVLIVIRWVHRIKSSLLLYERPFLP